MVIKTLRIMSIAFATLAISLSLLSMYMSTRNMQVAECRRSCLYTGDIEFYDSLPSYDEQMWQFWVPLECCEDKWRAICIEHPYASSCKDSR